MMRYGYGSGAGDWIAMTIFWAGLITLVSWAVSRALSSGSALGRDSTPRRESRGDDAEDILDRRFAAGELDEDTFRSMRATLRSAQTTQNEPR